MRNYGKGDPKMEKIRHDKRFWLALTIFSLTGQVAWTVENMYFNVLSTKCSTPPLPISP